MSSPWGCSDSDEGLVTCVLPNRRYFGSVADKVASEALAASHHVHSHQQAKETRSGLDATGSPRLSRRKDLSRSRVLDAPVQQKPSSKRIWGRFRKRMGRRRGSGFARPTMRKRALSVSSPCLFDSLTLHCVTGAAQQQPAACPRKN